MSVLETTTRVLAEFARELLCLADRDRRVVVATGPWAEAVGISSGGLVGVLLESLVSDGDRETLLTYFDATMAGIVHGSIDVTVSSGVRSRIHDVTLRQAEGGVVASFRDVTQQRRAEQMLTAVNERLQQTNDELRRSNEELQRFASVASHDLSEPLRMVTSYCALLVSDCGDQLDETAREYLGFAVDGAMRMRGLIDDLLQYSRVSSVAEPAVRVELANVFEEALRDLGPAIEETGAEVFLEPLPAVFGNHGQLRQLAVNLVGNALKFRSKGTVPCVVVTARTAGTEVRLSVTDNGIGIDEKHHERIFVMFKRLHGRGAYDGNGIGLALCKRIAERHGGNVWVEAARGGGSVFHVTLVSADTTVEVPA